MELNEENIKFDDILNEVEKDDYMILVDEAAEKKVDKKIIDSDKGKDNPLSKASRKDF